LISKYEKIASALITWPFIGSFAGLLCGALFGGRGGMVFVGLGLAVGLAGGLARSIWLSLRYSPSDNTIIIGPKRLLVNRIFIVFLYVLAIYTVIINVFLPEL
jgi:hypothetical protein